MIFDLDMFLPFRHSTVIEPDHSLTNDASGCFSVRGAVVLNKIDGFLFSHQLLREHSRFLDAMTVCDYEPV